MKYVFGPVPSRRLGQSLGVDTIPLKTCNWNCVYCQLGRSVPMTNERKEYFKGSEILEEVSRALDSHQPGEIDWITLVGSGEPTLNSCIGWLIRQVKRLTKMPVAVITNGALLYLPEVRDELTPADAVMPTLDAGTAEIYRRINRPWPELTFDRLVEGLIQFRKEYSGKLWLEVMLVQGINDDEKALQEIGAVLKRTRPDQVHINLPTRLPCESWVRSPNQDNLLQAAAILGENSHVILPSQGKFDFGGHENIEKAVVAVLSRHPLQDDVLRTALEEIECGCSSRILGNLLDSGQVQIIERSGSRFWSSSSTHYPENR